MAQMPEWGLTPEQQAELASLQRRQRLAAELQKQTAPRGVQMAGKIAVPSGRGEAIARLLAGLGSDYMDSSATKGQGEVVGRAGREAGEQMTQLLGAPDQKQSIAQALASQYPGIRQQGAVWQGQANANAMAQQKQAADMAIAKEKQRGDLEQEQFKQLAENLRAGAGVYKEYGAPQQAVTALSTGKMDQGVPPTPRAPDIVRDPATGKPTQATTYSLKGEQDVKFPGGISMTAEMKLPGEEGKLRLQSEQKELDEAKVNAQSAVAEIGNVARLVRAVEQGAQVGGGASVAQSARKFGQFFGVNFPATGPTDSARSALGERLLENVRKLAPVTQPDVDTVNRLVGSIDTDPTALAELSAWYTARALRSLQNYEKFVATKRSQSQSGDYATADIGIELPKNLPGPAWFQMLTMQALADQGGDISRFGDPATGQPMDRGSRFNLTPRAFGPNVPQPPSGVTIRRGN